jgi:tyrosine decarboxylase/aspartate 1-decarboxylase
MFVGSNLGDPGMFPGSRRLEKEAVHKLSNLLHGTQTVGFIVSGGTEANLMALWAARNKSKVANPEVIVPESAHFSFEKICDLLKLKLVRAKLDSSYKVDLKSVQSCISDQTVSIIGTAGTAELGIVDPIPNMSEIALDHEIHLHVDAAFGGLVIPFLESDAQDSLKFDFQQEGVKSITVDPHKMGMSTIPAGGILFRDLASLQHIKTETPYLTETPQFTVLGTRSAASVAATWAVFESFGREGFKKTVRHCIALTSYVTEAIKSSGLELVVKPTLNILAFRTSNSKATAQELRRMGWFVSYVPRLDCIRIVIMPHVKKRHLELFLTDLDKATIQ